MADTIPTPERTASIRRAAARYCGQCGWAPLSEVTLPSGRRADILALTPEGRLLILEVKSCARDFLSDRKWPEYREFCDALYFAVDAEFPQALLPADVGLVVATPEDSALLREAPSHPLAPPRRRALTLRYAQLAATRLAALSDPAGFAQARAALSPE